MAFSPLYMGTNHMLGVDNYIPITTNNFEIRLYNMDGSAAADNSDLLTLSTDSIGSIAEQQDTIVIHYGNGIIKFPSKVTFADVTWTLNCYAEPNVADAIRAWRKQVYDPDTEKMGLPSQYMRQAMILRYDGQGGIRDAIRLPGVWPGALTNGDYNQTGGSIVQLSLPLVVSRVIYLKKSDLGN